MPPTVLLCDDEIHILRAAELKFRRAGLNVQIAGDGEEAWAMIQKQPPDLLVTDYQMPRLDGLGLIQRLRQAPATQDVAVVLLTAKGFELDAQQLADEWAVTAVVAKPFSPRELLKTVQQLLADGWEADGAGKTPPIGACPDGMPVDQPASPSGEAGS